MFPKFFGYDANKRKTLGLVGSNEAPYEPEKAQVYAVPQTYGAGNLLHNWTLKGGYYGAKLTTQGMWIAPANGGAGSMVGMSLSPWGGDFFSRSANGSTVYLHNEDGYGFSCNKFINAAYLGGAYLVLGTDARLQRYAASVLQVANTAGNAEGDLKLRNLIGSGNLATGAVAKSADYTATTSDGTIEVDASGAARTITLFAASGNAGKILVIKKTDSSANAVTVDGNASETIDGATTISLASQYSTAILQVNAAGTGWNKLGGV